MGKSMESRASGEDFPYQSIGRMAENGKKQTHFHPVRSSEVMIEGGMPHFQTHPMSKQSKFQQIKFLGMMFGIIWGEATCFCVILGWEYESQLPSSSTAAAMAAPRPVGHGAIPDPVHWSPDFPETTEPSDVVLPSH